MRAIASSLLLAACMREVDVSAPPPGCRVGEMRDCYDGPGETREVGLCQDGTQQCGPDGRWGHCLGSVLPAPEAACDHQDNDCNGVVDDGEVYELDPASIVERRELLPMGDLLVAREGARVVAAWTVGVSSAEWTEQLHLVALSTELAGGRFPLAAEAWWTDQPPIVARSLLLAPVGDAGLQVTVHAAVERYGCLGRVNPLPLSDCGDRIYRHDGQGGAAVEPTSLAVGERSHRAVPAGDRLLIPEERGDAGVVALRSMTAETLAETDPPRVMPLRADVMTLRGLRVDDHIVWVSTFGGTLHRVETDLTGAPTVVLPPFTIHPESAALTALERVRDHLWAAVSTPGGMKICRWSHTPPSRVSVLDAGVLSDATLSYARDAGQVYLCGVAFGSASVQRFTTDGRPLPHPRPAWLVVDTNARCAVAATAQGAVVFTRQHHDGLVNWARYGCPVPRAPQ